VVPQIRHNGFPGNRVDAIRTGMPTRILINHFLVVC
jgi:hypothetical protein